MAGQDGIMTEDLIQLGRSGSGSSASDGSGSAAEEERKTEGEKQDDHGQDKLRFVLGKKAALSVSSLDSSASESLLEELLGDIRRSRPASLASTPTFVSSDYETDGVRDCGRSEAELKGMGEAVLSLPRARDD